MIMFSIIHFMIAFLISDINVDGKIYQYTWISLHNKMFWGKNTMFQQDYKVLSARC